MDTGGNYEIRNFYISKSGNTETIAQKIKEALPADECRIWCADLELAKQADLVFLGAPARANSFIKEMLDFMKELEHKKIAILTFRIWRHACIL